MLSFVYKGKALKAQIERPMELDTSAMGGDGFMRNLSKFKWEYIWSRHWATANKASHGLFLTAMLNNTVERYRHAPYLWGHVAFIGTPLLVIICLAI